MCDGRDDDFISGCDIKITVTIVTDRHSVAMFIVISLGGCLQWTDFCA